MSAKELAAKFQQQLNEKEANQKVLSGEHHASGGGAAGGGGAGAERRSSGSVKNAAAMFQQQLNDKEANQARVWQRAMRRVLFPLSHARQQPRVGSA